MNKLINRPEDTVSEMLDGYLSLYGGLFARVNGVNGLRLRAPQGKVSLVIGGGAGNEPWILGYVGRGLATGAALGSVYTAPPARAVLDVTRAVPHSDGVLYLCTNHMGDRLNFELVRELAGMEGINARCVYVTDDVTTAPPDQKSSRRGVAGIALATKIAGAACAGGCGLDEVVRITQTAVDHLYTCSVTVSPGALPGTGRMMFSLPEGSIEYGMGFNGETGILRTPLEPADAVADRLIDYLTEGGVRGQYPVAVLLNCYRGTSQLEAFILARRIRQALTERGISIHDMRMDTLFAPQETGGVSLTILELPEGLARWYDAPAWSPLFKMEGPEALK